MPSTIRLDAQGISLHSVLMRIAYYSAPGFWSEAIVCETISTVLYPVFTLLIDCFAFSMVFYVLVTANFVVTTFFNHFSELFIHVTKTLQMTKFMLACCKKLNKITIWVDFRTLKFITIVKLCTNKLHFFQL